MLLCAANQACAYASQAAAACTEYSRVAVENERLQHQLAQRQAAEDAYRELWLNADRCYTFDRTGRAVELLEFYLRVGGPVSLPDRRFPRATIISLKSAALTAVWYSRRRTSFVTLCCCRGSESFQESGSALPGLSEGPHTWSAGLLMRFSKSTALASLAAGRKWSGTLSVSACSPTTPPTPTVRSFDAPAETVECPVPSVAASALQQFQRLMRSVQDPFQRRLLTAWIHAAALSTLLDQLGHSSATGTMRFFWESKVANICQPFLQLVRGTARSH